jgi:sugar/nucleoside kinase (ribokinase family)
LSTFDHGGVVVVIGDVINDVIVRARGPIEVGSDTGSDIRRSPGGSGANQAAWLASLGVPVRFYGRAGVEDAAAHVDALKRVGVDARLAVDHRAPTGSIVVLVAHDGERSMFTDRGANRWLGASDVPLAPSDLAQVVHLHISGYTLFEPPARSAVAALIELAARMSIAISCDPSSESFLRAMGPACFLALTAGTTTLVPNLAEARLLGGMPDQRDEEVARALTAHYPAVVLKRGAAGALLARRGETPEPVEAPSAEVIDTTGAGDAFFAGYLAALLEGAAPLDAVRAGVRVGALAVAQMGGRPPAGRIGAADSIGPTGS